MIYDVSRFLTKHKTMGYLNDEEGENLKNQS